MNAHVQVRDLALRDSKGRFRKNTNPQVAESQPLHKATSWTPTERFMFDLEGELYKMGALAETMETMLVLVAGTLQRVNPPKAAALDYAATNLADAIKEISERYHDIRYPGPAVELRGAG